MTYVSVRSVDFFHFILCRRNYEFCEESKDLPLQAEKCLSEVTYATEFRLPSFLRGCFRACCLIIQRGIVNSSIHQLQTYAYIFRNEVTFMRMSRHIYCI
jgi:hypothetical protein